MCRIACNLVNVSRCPIKSKPKIPACNIFGSAFVLASCFRLGLKILFLPL